MQSESRSTSARTVQYKQYSKSTNGATRKRNRSKKRQSARGGKKKAYHPVVCMSVLISAL